VVLFIYWCVIVYVCVFDSSSNDDDDDGRTCAWARLCIQDPHNFFWGDSNRFGDFSLLLIYVKLAQPGT
jgi:hypothetical protein